MKSFESFCDIKKIFKRYYFSRKIRKVLLILIIIFIIFNIQWGESILHKLSAGNPIWPETCGCLKYFIYSDGVVFFISTWLFIILASGAMGGIVNHAYSNLSFQRNLGINKDKNDSHDEEYSLLNFMLAGAGAAICVTWFKIVLMSQTYPGNLTRDNIITVLSWSFVAGLFSIPLIELIQKKFIGAISSDDVKNIARKTISPEMDRIEREAEFTNAISKSRVLVHYGLPSEVSALIKKLEELKDEYPKDRSLYINLGMLYRRLGVGNNKKPKEDKDFNWDNVKKAIHVLEEYLSNITFDYQQGNRFSSESVSTPLYNMACYYSILAQSDESSDFYKQKAIELLDLAVYYNRDNIEDAKEDSDFDNIKSDENFIKALE